MPSTSTTRKGVFVGLAFPWEAQHTHVLEAALVRDGVLPTDPGPTRGYPALHAVGRHQEQPLVIPWNDWGGHTLLTGTTGSGKTALLQVIMHEMVAGDGPVLIIDPKGERDMLAHAALAARRHGKPFAVFTPAFPAASVRLNVLGTCTTTAEVSARIRALMPSAGGRTNEPFFEEFPLAIIERIAAAQQALGLPWTLEGLWSDVTVSHRRDWLLIRYLRHLGYTAKGLKALKAAYRQARKPDMLADALIEDHDWPAEHYRRITSTLIPTFRGVVGPPIGPLLSAVQPDLAWAQIVAEETVVYVSLASMLLGDIANRIGRVLIQDLIGMLGRRYAFSDCSKATPITVIVDELRQVLYPNFTTALAMARGAGARFVLAQQSMADAEYALGKPAARVMASNINTKLWMRLTDDDDSATVATEGLDTCDVLKPQQSVGVGYGGIGGLTGNASRSFTPKEAPVFRPHWLTALPTGQGILRARGSLWKLRVPLLTPVSEAERDALGLTALWQRLDPQTATPVMGKDELVIEAGGDDEDMILEEEET